jgi:archaellum biogenesis protein FlaJ (TadC family)
MWEWTQSHAGLIFAVSVGMFVASLVAMVVLIIRMPEDYFLHKRERPWKQSHPALRIALIVVRNIVGAALLLIGLIMLLTPGQGVLCILIGISLLDIPGKRKLETKIVQREPVHKSIDWIRSKAGRPPLKLPPRTHGD